MARPRAGHALTFIMGRGRSIPIIQADDGRWITTGEAQGWPRCSRCRRPYQLSPESTGLCGTCFFLKSDRSGRRFWDMRDHPQFPYNYGDMMHESMEWIAGFNDKRLCEDWRWRLRHHQPDWAAAAKMRRAKFDAQAGVTRMGGDGEAGSVAKP